LPRDLRPAFLALWNLDLALADVVATSSDPRLGAIRMAWWREQLEKLDSATNVPAEPRLQAVAAELLPRDVTGKELSELEDAWLPLLDPFPWSEPQAQAIRRRGQILFGIGARLLGSSSDEAARPGALWSLADAEHHCSEHRDYSDDAMPCAELTDAARSRRRIFVNGHEELLCGVSHQLSHAPCQLHATALSHPKLLQRNDLANLRKDLPRLCESGSRQIRRRRQMRRLAKSVRRTPWRYSERFLYAQFAYPAAQRAGIHAKYACGASIALDYPARLLEHAKNIGALNLVQTRLRRRRGLRH